MLLLPLGDLRSHRNWLSAYLKLASLDLIDTGARLSLSLGSRGVAMRWNLIYSFNY